MHNAHISRLAKEYLCSFQIVTMNCFADFFSQTRYLKGRTCGGVYLLVHWGILVLQNANEPVGNGEVEYCVCLSQVMEGEATRRLPCRHLFHRSCIKKWLDVCRRTCPLCRFPVEKEALGRSTELTEEMGPLFFLNEQKSDQWKRPFSEPEIWTS